MCMRNMATDIFREALAQLGLKICTPRLNTCSSSSKGTAEGNECELQKIKPLVRQIFIDMLSLLTTSNLFWGKD